MNSWVSRIVASVALVAAALALVAGPARADEIGTRATSLQRAAVMAGTLVAGGYVGEPGATVVYEAQAVEAQRAAGASTIAATCEGVLPLWWIYPYVLSIKPICWLEDTTTGADHYLADTNPSGYTSVATATGLFIVPTNHAYRLCVEFNSLSRGSTGSTCQALA